MEVSGIVSKRVFNESVMLYSSQHSCNTAHSRSIWSMVSVWPQWCQVVGGPLDKIWALVAFVWPSRSRVITTSSALVMCWNFFGGPSVGLRNRDLCHVQLHPTWFEPAAGCRGWHVVSNLHNGHPPEDLCHGQGSPSPAGQLISVYTIMAWYPAETNMCALVIQQPKEVHDMANKRVLSVFTLNRLQAGHWVRVNYYIVVDWAHVFVIFQCQSDGCSLSSKDGAVVWQFFDQVAAGCLTILEMAVLGLV